MNKNNSILVFRFSSLGDVAMTIPVIRALLEQNSDLEIIFVSKEQFQPLFKDIPNLKFYAADVKGKHKGFGGLFKLSKELKALNHTYLADLHNVLRTTILKSFLSGSVKKSAVLNKGRKERKKLLRKENKIRKPIRSMPERYADVFRKLGFKLELSHQLPINDAPKENAVGIAPFAMYEGKTYPIDKMHSIAKKLAEKDIKVYLFGGGKKETEELKKWEDSNPNIISIAGKYNLKEELEIIKKLKVMVSMDSANMHLASAVGTRVISIWGNTHPFMGFLGYGQSMEDVIQDETLTIRPTSVFGKEPKSSSKADYFKNISEEMIIEKVQKAMI